MKIPGGLGTKSIRSVFITARKWHGELHGRRWPISLAAAGVADLDAAAVCCVASRRRRWQAAANAAVVFLWVRMRAVRMATGCGARTPRSPDPPAVHVERGSPAAAPRGCARVARRAEYTLLPQSHQRTQTSVPGWRGPPALRLRVYQAGRGPRVGARVRASAKPARGRLL